MVEHQGRGEPGADAGADPIAEFHRRHRVHAEVTQWLIGTDGLGRTQAEGAGGLVADQGQDAGGAFGLRQPGQAVGELAAAAGAGRGQQRTPQGRRRAARGGRGLPQPGQVQGPGDEVGRALGQGEFDEFPARVGGEGAVAGPGHPCEVGVFCGEAFTCPGPEGDGGAGQAQGPPVVGELVEEDIGRGVVGLARVADDSRGGGDQQEEGERRVGGEPVQMAGAVGLGAQHVREAVGGEVGDHPVVEDARAVHDAAQRRFGADAAQDVGHGRRVRDVARGDLGLGAERAQFGDDVGRPRIVRTTS
ncbi:hypothetical protein GCM10023335_77970 [Streptomyces siamensis]|uniref:Uncharacterized protein n=1 Tax=Streptomyces siamensis TaxID=1274986 RepID=A0ABP9JLX0_9ACTN